MVQILKNVCILWNRPGKNVLLRSIWKKKNTADFHIIYCHTYKKLVCVVETEQNILYLSANVGQMDSCRLLTKFKLQVYHCVTLENSGLWAGWLSTHSLLPGWETQGSQISIVFQISMPVILPASEFSLIWGALDM